MAHPPGAAILVEPGSHLRMSLAQTLWPNADPDADGKAPLGRGDHVARVARHFCVPYLFPNLPLPLRAVQPAEGTSAANSSKARRGRQRPEAFIGYQAEREGAYGTGLSISDLRRLPSRRKPSVE